MAETPDIEKMTVKELKGELRKDGLPLSGKKADFIERLKCHRRTNQTITTSHDEYDKITVAELKKQLRSVGLPQTGKKADLIKRLAEYEDAQSELAGSITGSKDTDIEMMLALDDTSLNSLCRCNKYYSYICKDKSGYFWKRRLENLWNYKFSPGSNYNYKKLYENKKSLPGVLNIIASMGYLELVRIILPRLDDMGHCHGCQSITNMVRIAASHGRLPVVKYILEARESQGRAAALARVALISASRGGRLAKHAASNGHWNIIRYLITRDVANTGADSLLKLAIRRGNLEMVQFIVTNNPDVDIEEMKALARKKRKLDISAYVSKILQ